jgi:transposase
MARSTPSQYPVVLTDAQRDELEAVCKSGRSSARKIRRARVLLLSDRNRADGKLSRDQVSKILGLHVNSVDRIRKRFFLEGAGEAIIRKPRATPPVPRKIDGKMEAQVIAICCSPAPKGHARWTLSLLVEEIKKRRIITSISAETVRKTLKKMNCSLGGKNVGVSRKKTRRDS